MPGGSGPGANQANDLILVESFARSAARAHAAGMDRIAEIVAPVGTSEPLHVHDREDECFWVHEGELTVRRGDETLRVRSGEFMFLPHDVPHGYRVDGDAPARLLAIWSPARFRRPRR